MFDMCFYDWVKPDSPFVSPGWEHWCERILKISKDLGVEFGQCHAHYFDFLDESLSEEQWEYEYQMVIRSMDFCSRLGSRVCVTHPDTVKGLTEYRKKSLEANREYFKRLLEDTEELGVSIAVENMCDYSVSPKRKYTSYPEELVELVDSIGSSRLGICWDFEHAEIMEQNQVNALEYIGKRLIATHVSDTHSKINVDLMHIMPCFGDMDWQPIMKTLKNIGYHGDFSFEAHNFANRLPDEVLDTALKLSYEIGEYLISLA